MSLIVIKVPGVSRGMHGANDIVLIDRASSPTMYSPALRPVPTGYTRTGDQHNARAQRIQVPPAVAGHCSQIIDLYKLTGALKNLETHGSRPNLTKCCRRLAWVHRQMVSRVGRSATLSTVSGGDTASTWVSKPLGHAEVQSSS
jgi:hypothetical protein